MAEAPHPPGMRPQPFRYRALDASHHTVEGTIEALSRTDALAQLAAQALVPLGLEGAAAPTGPLTDSGAFSTLSRRLLSLRLGIQHRAPRLTRPALLGFLQALSALLASGLTLDRALQVASELGDSPADRLLARALLAQVRDGRPLSDALQSRAEGAPAYLASMIRAGESGGALSAAIARAAELLEQQMGVQERVRTALLYPALVGVVIGATLVVLLAFVLPRFEVLFAESEAPVPWLTQAVLSLGAGVRRYGLIALAALGVVGAGLLRLRAIPAGRQRWDRWWLESRITAGLPAAHQAARWLRTIGTLLENGAGLPQALRISHGTLTNSVLAAGADDCLLAVMAGEPLSEALARMHGMPRVAAQLARVGEESGALAPMLLRSAAVLERRVQTRLERLLMLLVPGLTIAMGLVVALLVGAVLLGLLSLNDLAV